MKKIIGVVTCLLLVVSINAQDKKAQREAKKAEILEAKKEFFAEEVPLSQPKLEAFWTQYLKMDEERKALRKEYKGPKKDELENLSEAEAEAFLKKRLELERKQVELREKYYKRYSEILTQKEILKVQIAQRKFKKELLKELKGNAPKD